MAETELIDLPDDVADRDRALALELITGMQAVMAEMKADTARVVAENW
jgi:hypothetical protein